MICSKCNNELNNLITKTSKFCPFCGANIEEELQESFNHQDENVSNQVQNNVSTPEDEHQIPNIPTSETSMKEPIVIDRGPKLEKNPALQPPLVTKEKKIINGESVVPIGVWLLFLLGISIPVINIVTFAIALFSSKYRSRRNFVLALLIFTIICTVITVLASVLIVILIPTVWQSIQEFFTNRLNNIEA